MLKKLTLLAMSVGALLAFAAPAAQANGPLITNSLGEAPTEITALSTNTKTVTEAGTLECTTTDLSLHITENANTAATAHGTGTMTGTPAATHTGHCGTSSGLRTEFTSVSISDWNLTRHGEETTGTATFSITYDMRTSGGALIAECTFGNPTEKATVQKTGANTLHVAGKVVKTAGSAFCPSSGTLTGDFIVTDKPNGLPVTIH